MVAATA